MSGSGSAAALIREEIARAGPIPFDLFMELALYGPGAGYYTRERDPFGRSGDFFTAEQLQPVFGRLIAAVVRRRRDELGHPPGFCVVELGPGRREMAEALAEFDYLGVDAADALPASITGVVFANEFFDALPVRVAERRPDGWIERLVQSSADGFAFVDGPPPSGAIADYLARYHGDAPEGSIIEVNLRALDWIRRVGRVLTRGYLIAIDYGYTGREWIRHTAGTLMGYHCHVATEDVLVTPGDRDITAHVAWTPLQDAAQEAGWRVDRFENMSAFLLRAGEGDAFESALSAADEPQSMKLRLQLKTLLYGMGETFRVLTLSK